MLRWIWVNWDMEGRAGRAGVVVKERAKVSDGWRKDIVDEDVRCCLVI